MSVTALAAREKLRGGLGQAKVRRYWPGKAPEWSETEGHDHDDVLMRNKADVLATTPPYDQRLQRLTKTITENRKLVRQEAEIVSTEEPRDSEEDDAIDETRGRIREKNLKRDQEEEASLLPIEVDEEEASEYETDSEEEEMCHITMIKPVFVQRAKRDTIAEREMLEAKEQALEESAKRALEMRKLETKQIVVEEVKNYEELRKNLLSEEGSNGDVDTDDEVDEAQEYKVWKTREIARTKRQRDASEAIMQEVDKLKKMTEHEKNDPELLWKDKPKKRKFMQRYYHKGAFFQETGSADGIFDRDFSAPTGEDKLDRTKLRKVMQVKRFGRSVRSKWTHLVNEDTTYDGKNTKREDTTDWADLWITNCFLREKYKKKIAAMDGPIAKPKGNKKMKV